MSEKGEHIYWSIRNVQYGMKDLLMLFGAFFMITSLVSTRTVIAMFVGSALVYTLSQYQH